MPYSDLISISLGSSQSGLTLNSQVLDQYGGTLIGGISGVFTELGGGNYLWYYTGFPFELSVAKIYAVPNSGVFACVTLDPPNEEGAILGSNIVTLEVEDQFANPIGSCRIEITPSGSSNIVDYGYTNNSNGEVVFNLDSGQYAFYAVSPGYAYYNNPYFYDIENSQTIGIQGTTYISPGPIGVGTSRLYTYAVDIGLTPRAGIRMVVRPSGTDQSYQRYDALLNYPLTSSSDCSGYIYQDLGSGIPVQVQIPSAGIDLYLVTPSSGSLNIATLY